MKNFTKKSPVRHKRLLPWALVPALVIPALALAANAPPGVPTATWLARNATQAMIAWTGPADSDLAGYKVYWGSGSNPYPNYTDVGNTTTYTTSAVGTGFAVTAYDTQGNEGDYQHLGTVTGVAPPSDLSASPVSSSQVNLTWSEAYPTETGFRVKGRIQGTTTFSTMTTTAANATSASVTGLEGCTTYEFQVHAIATVGSTTLEADGSNTATATTEGTSPSAPANLAANAPTSSRVDLSWTDTSASSACAADSFGIYRDNVEIARTTGPTTTYSDTTVQAGKTYSYKVRAYLGTNASGFSNSVSVTVGGTQSVTIAGTRDKNNPVTVTVPANSTVTISNAGGTVCLVDSLDCNGIGGTTSCSDLHSECGCPDQCGNGKYGALMRDGCVQVQNNQTFTVGSSGKIDFFVNGDCNPSNNTGSFSLTVTY